MQAYLVAKLVKRYMLIISSGYEYRLLLECVKSCRGACGACSDGVVYKSNSVEYPHLLKIMRSGQLDIVGSHELLR